MTLEERIARQREIKARETRRSPAPPAQAPADAKVLDRIAKQRHRAAVNAAIAALVKPVPDYVYREPRMPAARPTPEERLALFREDRTYDDIKGNADMVSQIRTAADMAKVIRAEQPAEFVNGEKDQVRRGGPSFMTIDNQFLEGPGYRSLPRVDENARDRIIDAPETPEPASVPTLKIDLTRLETKAPVPPAPVQESQKQDGPIEMNTVQRQMLAAMRAQRMNKGI